MAETVFGNFLYGYAAIEQRLSKCSHGSGRFALCKRPRGFLTHKMVAVLEHFDDCTFYLLNKVHRRGDAQCANTSCTTSCAHLFEQPRNCLDINPANEDACVESCLIVEHVVRGKVAAKAELRKAAASRVADDCMGTVNHGDQHRHRTGDAPCSQLHRRVSLHLRIVVVYRV